MRSPGMPRDLEALVIAVLLWVAGPGSASASPVVILDPGHGGHDEGASVARVYEKHLNLDLAYRVAGFLERSGYRVRLSRRSDQFVSLAQRTKLADRYSSAILVSLHFNWTRNTSTRGIEIYHSGGSQSMTLARSIHRSLLRSSGTPDRGLRKREFFVIRKTRHPAVLIECGYLSNTTERRLCCAGWYRDRLARGIADGISRSLR
jgi:N-acetylmuramoyl-L-alanine amidase